MKSFQQNQEANSTEDSDLVVSSYEKVSEQPKKKTRRKKSLMEHYKIVEPPSMVDSNSLSSTNVHTHPSISGLNIVINGTSPTSRKILPSISSVMSTEIGCGDDSNILHGTCAQLLPPIVLLNDYKGITTVNDFHVRGSNNIGNQTNMNGMKKMVNNNTSSVISNTMQDNSLDSTQLLKNSIKKRKNRKQENTISPTLLTATSGIHHNRDFQVEYTGNNSIFGVLKKPKHANVASYETILNLSDNRSVTPATTTLSTSWSQDQIQPSNKKKRKYSKPQKKP